MPGTYVEVSAERLVKLLMDSGAKITKRGGTFVEERVGRERVFSYTAPGRPSLRVYSSLGAGKSTARGNGKDAIRLIVGVELPEGFRKVIPVRRVFRTAPRAAADREGVLLERLRRAMNDAWRSAMRVPRCPKCGALMAERIAQKGTPNQKKFHGCIEYPRCRGTKPLTGDDLRG